MSDRRPVSHSCALVERGSKGPQDSQHRLRTRARSSQRDAHRPGAAVAEMPRQHSAAPELGLLTRQEVVPRELTLRRLTTPGETAAIHSLRQDIALPAALRADPTFLRLEKKEMRSASCAPLHGAERRSAR